MIFNPFFLDRLFVTALFPLCVTAFIIIVRFPGVTRAAIPYHHLSTLAAKQFRGQQKFIVSFRRRWGAFVLLAPHLHPVKKLLGDNGGNSIRNNRIAVMKFTDVCSVLQKFVEAGIFELFAFAGLNPAPVQVLYNLPQWKPWGGK